MTEVVRIDRDGDGIARPHPQPAAGSQRGQHRARRKRSPPPSTSAGRTRDARRRPTGAGDRAFSAGVDLREASTMEVSRIEEWFGTVCRTSPGSSRSTSRWSPPSTASAAGAGFQIALVSDLRVGHPGIRMGQPEINAGLPSVMGSYWMTLHLGLGQEPGALLYRPLHGLRGMRASRAARGGGGGRPGARQGERARRGKLCRQGADRVPPDEGALPGACDAGVRGGVPGGTLGQQAAYAQGEPQAIMASFLGRRRS